MLISLLERKRIWKPRYTRVDQRVKPFRLYGNSLDAAGFAEQFFECYKAECEWDVSNRFLVSVLETRESGHIVRHVYDFDFAFVIFTANLCLMLVILDGTVQRVDMVLHVLVAQSAAMCFVSVNASARLKIKVLHVAVLPPRNIRLVDRRTEATRCPLFVVMRAEGQEVNEALVEHAFRQAVRGSNVVDKCTDACGRYGVERGTLLVLVGHEHKVAAYDVRNAAPRRVRKLRHDVENVRKHKGAVLGLSRKLRLGPGQIERVDGLGVVQVGVFLRWVVHRVPERFHLGSARSAFVDGASREPVGRFKSQQLVVQHEEVRLEADVGQLADVLPKLLVAREVAEQAPERIRSLVGRCIAEVGSNVIDVGGMYCGDIVLLERRGYAYAAEHAADGVECCAGHVEDGAYAVEAEVLLDNQRTDERSAAYERDGVEARHKRLILQLLLQLEVVASKVSHTVIDTDRRAHDVAQFLGRGVAAGEPEAPHLAEATGYFFLWEREPDRSSLIETDDALCSGVHDVRVDWHRSR